MQVVWVNAKFEDAPRCYSASLQDRGATELLAAEFACECRGELATRNTPFYCVPRPCYCCHTCPIY